MWSRGAPPRAWPPPRPPPWNERRLSQVLVLSLSPLTGVTLVGCQETHGALQTSPFPDQLKHRPWRHSRPKQTSSHLLLNLGYPVWQVLEWFPPRHVHHHQEAVRLPVELIPHVCKQRSSWCVENMDGDLRKITIKQMTKISVSILLFCPQISW